jgi:dUTPase
MDLQVHTSEETQTLLYEDGSLVFLAAKPIIIQPSEIMKVQTGLSVRVPFGYVLNISTAPALSVKAGELFPGLIAVGASITDVELNLPVKNSGRNVLNIMAGQTIAVGHVVKTEEISLKDFEPQDWKVVSNAESKPQKKNPNFKFEIRG